MSTSTDFRSTDIFISRLHLARPEGYRIIVMDFGPLIYWMGPSLTLYSYILSYSVYRSLLVVNSSSVSFFSSDSYGFFFTFILFSVPFSQTFYIIWRLRSTVSFVSTNRGEEGLWSNFKLVLISQYSCVYTFYSYSSSLLLYKGFLSFTYLLTTDYINRYLV